MFPRVLVILRILYLSSLSTYVLVHWLLKASDAHLTNSVATFLETEGLDCHAWTPMELMYAFVDHRCAVPSQRLAIDYAKNPLCLNSFMDSKTSWALFGRVECPDIPKSEWVLEAARVDYRYDLSVKNTDDIWMYTFIFSTLIFTCAYVGLILTLACIESLRADERVSQADVSSEVMQVQIIEQVQMVQVQEQEQVEWQVDSDEGEDWLAAIF